MSRNAKTVLFLVLYVIGAISFVAFFAFVYTPAERKLHTQAIQLEVDGTRCVVAITDNATAITCDWKNPLFKKGAK